MSVNVFVKTNFGFQNFRDSWNRVSVCRFSVEKSYLRPFPEQFRLGTTDADWEASQAKVLVRFN
jgi:hypothetical protein